MKRIYPYLLALYTVIFSLTVNCFSLLAENTAMLTLAVTVFAILTVGMGYFCINTVKTRLRICFHGAVALIVFQASTAVAVIVHTVWLVFGIEGTEFWYSVLFCFILEFLLFWNGILCVYFASYRLSLKQRVKGILVGLIPIWNLIVLNSIIKTVFDEVKSETEREEERREKVLLQECNTKYPILLVHGVFFRDSKIFNYWGRIPKELKINGARIFYGNHQSADSVANCAKELSERIESIVKATGCEKVNIIAHSKGGLDCRYAIAHYGVGKYVASLTTVNTPHRGCEFAEYLKNELPKNVVSRIESFYNRMWHRFGDHHPDFMAAVTDLTANVCIERDKEMPIPEGIYCQSIGSVMNASDGGRFPLNFSYVLVKHFNGENDGLVSEDSFNWGEKYLLLRTEEEIGISHCDIIDLNRKDINGFDVRDFYVDLVSDLKARGF